MEGSMAQEKDRNDEGYRRSDGLSDMLKGAISSGVQKVFLTEEGVRGMLLDFIPREVGAYVKTQLDGLKKEMYSAVIGEFANFLKHVDVGREVRKAMSGMKVKITTEIEIVEPQGSPTQRAAPAPGRTARSSPRRGSRT
jgi:hypothetical protein